MLRGYFADRRGSVIGGTCFRLFPCPASMTSITLNDRDQKHATMVRRRQNCWTILPICGLTYIHGFPPWYQILYHYIVPQLNLEQRDSYIISLSQLKPYDEQLH